METKPPPYLKFKAEYPDCVLLFQAGDTYIVCGEDAAIAGNVLGLIVRGTGDRQSTAFRAEKLDEYLRKLVAAGYRAALCEQVNPKEAMGRKVTRQVSNEPDEMSLLD